MKFHVIVGSDLLEKNLDLSLPHHKLNAQGMLQQPSFSKPVQLELPLVALEKEEVVVHVLIPEPETPLESQELAASAQSSSEVEAGLHEASGVDSEDTESKKTRGRPKGKKASS